MSNKSTIQPNIATFEKGMYLGAHTSSIPQGFYPYARNMIKRDQFQDAYLSNEHGNFKLIQRENVIGDVHINNLNAHIFIQKNGEIYYYSYEDNSEKLVMSFAEFGCEMEVKDCEYLNVQYSTKGCDVHVYWSSNCTYYSINLSELLDPIRKDALIEKITGECQTCNNDCKYFEVFRPKCNAVTEGYVQQTGGDLPAGAYVYSVRQLNSDNSFTNWSEPSKPHFIGSEFNIPGENSNGRITLEICGLDCNYNQIEIAVTYYDGSQITTRILGTFYYNKDNYTYHHVTLDEKGSEAIDTQEVLSRFVTNLKGSDIFIHDNMAYYFGIKEPKKYNIFDISKNIKVEAVIEQYSLEDAKRYQVRTLPYGETIALGFSINHDDGTTSEVGLIPCNNSGGSDNSDSTNSLLSSTGTSTRPVGGDAISSFGDRYTRTRQSTPNTVSNTQNDDQISDIVESLVDSYNNDIVTEFKDGAKSCTDCDGVDPIIEDKIDIADEIGAKWGSIISDYIGSESGDDLSLNFTPSTIVESAKSIINAVKNRERIIEAAPEVFLSRDNIEYNTQENGLQASGINQNTSHRDPSYPGGRILAVIPTKCKEDEVKYPCIRTCEGDLVYGEYTGRNVAHHTLPDETEQDFYRSNSVGVPSKLTPDADEYADGYVNAIGLRFSNINLDPEEYYQKTGKRVCPNNPINFHQVPLDYSNQTILLKGLATGNYVAENKGKEYVFQRHAVNSSRTVNRYIDIEGSRLAQDRAHNSVCVYSLDQCVLEPYIGSATKMKVVKQFSGIGAKHCQYAEGKRIDNATFGRRNDQRGTIQSTNLSKQSDVSIDVDIDYAMYIDGPNVVAPPSGGDIPLMNKFGQRCVWVGGFTSDIRDKSFIGDVLEHSSPLDWSSAYYVVLYRELPNQYGPVTNLQFTTILTPCVEMGEIPESVAGLVGDRFIAPYSYVKTSWVSDKVGDKFPIGDVVEGKEDRCICDDPEDTVNNEMLGKFFWTNLPKDGDLADAKNWAGLHSDPITLTWAEANELDEARTDYYYPGTLTHLNTFWGESIANPWMVERSNELENQRYPFIKAQYNLASCLDHEAPWEDSYLNLFYVDNPQPSAAQKMIKVLAKSLVNLFLAMYGITEVFNSQTPLELAGDLVNLPIFAAVYLLLTKVLLTDDFIDDFIGLKPCKTDSEGGIDFEIKKYFQNFDRYSFVFSQKRDLKKHIAIQEFNDCDCGDECGGSDKVYTSNKQIPTSNYDGFKHVNPNSFFIINQKYGQLKDLFISSNGGFFGHTTEGILNLIPAQQRIPSNTGDIVFNSTAPSPQFIIGFTPEGYAGIQNRSHAIDTGFGRFFIDYEAETLFVFNGRQTKPITYNGAAQFFKNYTKFCSTSNCVNEHQGQGYALGIDHRNYRLLVTKNDGDSSWTLSFDITGESPTPVSFHDYFPDKYIYTREDMYCLKDSGFYSHKATQTEDVKYTTYFGQHFPFILDVKHSFGNHLHYRSHEWRTDLEQRNCDNILLNRDETFNKVAVWNSRQGMGVHNMIVSKIEDREVDLDTKDLVNPIKVYRAGGSWRINELYDYTIDHQAPIISKPNCCLPFIEPVNTIDHSDRNVQKWKNRKIRDNFLYTRLIRENMPDQKLYVKMVAVMADDKRR